MVVAKKFKALLSIFVCLFALFTSSLALSQGAEFERFRSSDYQAPLIGQELSTEYYLAIGDKLNVFVWQNPDLSKTIAISPDGKIHYPLIGAVQAANLTVSQLQDKLKQKLSAYIRYPDVTITVVKTAGKKILVFGEVIYPGVYTYEGRVNIIEAIALAGDFTSDAKRESIIVVSDNMTEDPTVRRLNLFRALRRGVSDPDFMLKAGDVIYVPRTFIADFTKFMNDFGSWVNNANTITSGIWDWKREIKWLYQRNFKTLTSEHEGVSQ